MVHPILILTVDSNSSKNIKEAFYIMDGRTDGHMVKQKDQKYLFMKVALILFLAIVGTKVIFMLVALMSFFNYRWHLCHFKLKVGQMSHF